jgi:hypothetical protein
VLLSNQRRQNKEMSIDVFYEFPLPVPPLDDDPFSSLSDMDLAAMKVDNDDANGSSSRYEEEEGDDDDDDEDYNE